MSEELRNALEHLADCGSSHSRRNHWHVQWLVAEVIRLTREELG
jgi:hypothetical protein